MATKAKSSLPTTWRIVLRRSVAERIIVDAIDLVCATCGHEEPWSVTTPLPTCPRCAGREGS